MRGQISETQRQKQVITRLKNENDKLREETKQIPLLQARVRTLEEELEKAFLLIEELQRMIFKKKKKKNDKDDTGNDLFKPDPRANSKREACSYRRETPKDEDITDEETHNIQACPHCQAELLNLKKLEFFTEDILPPAAWWQVLKKVTRHFVTTGYCPHCQQRVSPVEIPKQKTSLGKYIRQLLIFQFTVQQLSYSQIIDFSEGVLHLKLSEGDIANTLANQATLLEADYLRRQKQLLESEAVHWDETGWPTSRGGHGNYAWVAASALTEDVVYSLGQSRGKGNIKKLLGGQYSGVGITDDYGAYKNAFQRSKHALCWAHPHRKIRDLMNAETLPQEKKRHCQNTFITFSALYAQIREVNKRPFVQEEREKETLKLRRVFTRFIRPHPQDPTKLKQIKKRLGEQIDCYFVCLLRPHVPPDNNRAERALRHLVLKRRKSFGSKTQKGANALSIIYTVVMSLWRKSKQDFFTDYSQALKPLGGQ